MTQRTTMRRWLRKGLAALCALACAAGVAACGSGGSDDGDVIKVGICHNRYRSFLNGTPIVSGIYFYT